MSTRNMMSMAVGLLLATAAWSTASAQSAASPYGFGSPVSPAELAKYFAIPPDGRGLPPGSGNATAGAKVFAENCAACHGDKLQGNTEKGIGGDRLLGGRDTLATKAPVKTVEAVCDGFRNAYDFDFNLDGEPFTYDSDNERCVGLPWYEPCRFYHIVPGGNYGWRSPQLSQTWRKPGWQAQAS